MLGYIIVAVVVSVVTAGLTHVITVNNLRKDADSKIGNADSKAREIIDDALKRLKRRKKKHFWK